MMNGKLPLIQDVLKLTDESVKCLPFPLQSCLSILQSGQSKLAFQSMCWEISTVNELWLNVPKKKHSKMINKILLKPE